MSCRNVPVFATIVLLLAWLVLGALDLQEPHRACLQASSAGRTWYYDIRTDDRGPARDPGVVVDNPQYEDTNTYAAFHLPEGERSVWDEGVAFAATMQSRNAWLNNEPTTAAEWVYDSSTGEDVMTFHTTVDGGLQDYIFRTNQCLDLPVQCEL
jgi:hypothetical protein